MNVLVLIPARGGSKGIPRKNLTDVGGLSLVARAVLTGRQFVRRAGLDDAMVLVDTDAPEIAAEAEQWGASVPFMRPAELAQDTTPTSANVRLVLERLARSGRPVDAVVLLQPTSPLRTVDDVVACWRLFDPEQVPSVVSVSAYHYPVEYALHCAPDGTVAWAGAAAPRSSRRQDFETLFTTNGAVYVGTAERFVPGPLIVPGVTRAVVMPPDRSADVDAPEDLRLVRALAAAWPVPPARVGARAVGPGAPCMMVLDIGSAWERDEAGSSALLDAAADMGWEAVRLAPPATDAGAVARGQWRGVMRHAASAGLATMLDVRDGADLAAIAGSNVAALCVSAGQLSDGALRASLAQTSRTVLCSARREDLAGLVEALEQFRADGGQDVALVCSEQPNDIATARFALERPVGWLGAKSDEVSLAAVAAGAAFLMLTSPRVTWRTGQADDDGATLSRMVGAVRRAEVHHA
jgi:CMP-N,N'-diacetyllegionaminic acid synthase